uniref:Uncharacterized protein n=1 Tax=Cryptomonas curvata TaxID=233186 RepID=A0A7S0MGV2_9CRYP|mmetsp:Transcript_40664/g.84890  ORF Transcript_40664/g.84890 Transcript_40664/m.84890 type:complete len:157 (+) Transcript_40664:35-505(+)
MRVAFLLCFVLALNVHVAFCFSPDFQVLKRFFGKPHADQILDPSGKSRDSFLCVLKNKILTKPSWMQDAFYFNETKVAAAAERLDTELASEEPPFSSGFVPLLRAVFPRKPIQVTTQEETKPMELVDNDARPPSSSTVTLSRYSRGFIPILRYLLQ